MNFCLQVKTADIFAVSVETLDKLSSVTNFELGHGEGGGHGTWFCSVVSLSFIMVHHTLKLNFGNTESAPNEFSLLCFLQKV